ncbi:MAG: Gfo/Idh/MocA family oxidoreductase [Steroidobacteraceae bacterium]|nr:Gfo/Idh/MocA family oxidoreductase [Steroidobacteraceae bacterium]
MSIIGDRGAQGSQGPQNMQKVRTAVIGVGYLGRFHAQKYASLPAAELVAVVDSSAGNREQVAAETGCRAVADYRDILGEIDAVSIATPTPLHYPIAQQCLERGVHVLVEKPITTTLEEARSLVDTAARAGRVLQVGHLERFNAAILALEGTLGTPRFVESHRLAPFKERGTDVNVVLDLMIHDIDLIQSLVGAPIASIDAVGASVFSAGLDIANARIRYANGCVANTTASRVSMKMERKLRVFQDDAYISIDLQQKVLTIVRKPPAGADVPKGQVLIEERTYDQGDALKFEIEAFLRSIREGTPPMVTGEDGLRALETAMKITQMVQDDARR